MLKKSLKAFENVMCYYKCPFPPPSPLLLILTGSALGEPYCKGVISGTFGRHIAVGQVLITLVRRQTNFSWRKITLQIEQ